MIDINLDDFIHTRVMYRALQNNGQWVYELSHDKKCVLSSFEFNVGDWIDVIIDSYGIYAKLERNKITLESGQVYTYLGVCDCEFCR
jgi:hypothetical protein